MTAIDNIMNIMASEVALSSQLPRLNSVTARSVKMAIERARIPESSKFRVKTCAKKSRLRPLTAHPQSRYAIGTMRPRSAIPKVDDTTLEATFADIFIRPVPKLNSGSHSFLGDCLSSFGRSCNKMLCEDVRPALLNESKSPTAAASSSRSFLRML